MLPKNVVELANQLVKSDQIIMKMTVCYIAT